MQNPWSTYGDGQRAPLGAYALLMGGYGVALGLLLRWVQKNRAATRGVAPTDLVLAGVATHKLTRILTREWVTAPVRAPFTQFERMNEFGEVVEKSRGSGMQRALGDLLTCAFCAGPWVAGALMAGYAAAPRPTRVVAGLFTAVAISDFLHRGYELTRQCEQAEKIETREKLRQEQLDAGEQ